MIIISELVKEAGRQYVHLQVLPLRTHRGPMKGDKFGINVEYSNIHNDQKGNELLHKIVRALSLDVLNSQLLSTQS